MRQMLYAVIYVFLGFLLTSCNSLPSRGEQTASATPEEAVRASVLKGTALPHSIVESFKVQGVRPWEHGSIVLYSMLNQRQPQEELWYYHFVTQRKQGWHAIYGKGFNNAMFEAKQSVAFRTDEVTIEGKQYLVIFGHASKPANKVEIRFMNQLIIQDSTTKNMFLVIAPIDAIPQELRVFNQQEAMIERVDLSPQFSGGAASTDDD
jgi:hypothetical protein